MVDSDALNAALLEMNLAVQREMFFENALLENYKGLEPKSVKKISSTLTRLFYSRKDIINSPYLLAWSQIALPK